METRPPPPGRQATGEEYQRRLPAPQVSLFANFLMCPPTCLRGITSCLPPHPQPHNFPRRPVCVRPKPESGRGPGGVGGGVPGAPALGVGRSAGRGLFTRQPSPPSAARTPPARPGPAPLTSVHQFEALGFPAPLPLRELHGAAGGQGRGCGRGRPGGGTERAAAEAAAAALALVTRQRERGDQGPSLGSAGGRHKQGKNHSSPPGGCGRRGRAGGALPGEVAPSWPPLSSPPDPGSSPAAGLDAAGAELSVGERVGGGEGGPGLPAPWALAAGRPGYSSGRGGGGERGPGDAAGGPRAAAAAAARCEPGRGADRPRGRRGAGRRRRRRDPGATCWRSAAAAIPRGPGSRHPPAWPRGARRRSQRPRRCALGPAGPPAPGDRRPCQALGSRRRDPDAGASGAGESGCGCPGGPGSRLRARLHLPGADLVLNGSGCRRPFWPAHSSRHEIQGVGGPDTGFRQVLGGKKNQPKPKNLPI